MSEIDPHAFGKAAFWLKMHILDCKNKGELLSRIDAYLDAKLPALVTKGGFNHYTYFLSQLKDQFSQSVHLFVPTALKNALELFHAKGVDLDERLPRSPRLSILDILCINLKRRSYTVKCDIRELVLFAQETFGVTFSKNQEIFKLISLELENSSVWEYNRMKKAAQIKHGRLLSRMPLMKLLEGCDQEGDTALKYLKTAFVIEAICAIQIPWDDETVIAYISNSL